jgi:hypothetical protein
MLFDILMHLKIKVMCLLLLNFVMVEIFNNILKKKKCYHKDKLQLFLNKFLMVLKVYMKLELCIGILKLQIYYYIMVFVR